MCRHCRASYFCQHRRIKWRCTACFGNSVCPHGREQHSCVLCGSRCHHGRAKGRCKPGAATTIVSDTSAPTAAPDSASTARSVGCVSHAGPPVATTASGHTGATRAVSSRRCLSQHRHHSRWDLLVCELLQSPISAPLVHYFPFSSFSLSIHPVALSSPCRRPQVQPLRHPLNSVQQCPPPPPPLPTRCRP